LATKVDSGRVSSCFSKLVNPNSRLRMNGPPTQKPVVSVVKVPGLNVCPAASLPTKSSLR
jgi:hypothetical protein